jgi:hypothetical protein
LRQFVPPRLFRFRPSAQPQDLTLAYPQLANMANVAGDLVLHLRIGADGTPVILGIKGKQKPKLTRLLSIGATATVSILRYPSACANQKVDLEFSYRKEDRIGLLKPGISRRLGPNHFQVLTTKWATDQKQSP